MKNNVNIDNTIENIEDVAVETVEKVVKADKITSAKMLQSTKDIIDTFNLEGNQQERLDTLVKEYKRLSEEAQKVAKEEVTQLDLSGEFATISKELDIFVKSIEQKINTYMDDTVATNVSNTEKEFKKTHNEFMRYLDEIREVAVTSENKLDDKNKEIEELVSKINELTDTVNSLKKDKEELIKENKDLITGIEVKEVMVQKERKEKYKSEDALDAKTRALANEKLKHSNTQDELNDLKSANFDLKASKKELKADNKRLEEENTNLQAKNKELEVSLAEINSKYISIEEENKQMQDIKKDIFGKTELIAQLEKRNELLENNLKELNVLKAKNVELEGTVKALESQSRLLETTLNTINATISSITDAKVVAEEKSTKLETENTRLADENSKLLKELEDLKKQLKAKK